jgi:hypothetical protein
MKNLKNKLATITLSAIMLIGATAASAETGILMTDERNANQTPSNECSVKTDVIGGVLTSLVGILMSDRGGILMTDERSAGGCTNRGGILMTDD